MLISGTGQWRRLPPLPAGAARANAGAFAYLAKIFRLLPDAVTLNRLGDWKCFHEAVFDRTRIRPRNRYSTDQL